MRNFKGDVPKSMSQLKKGLGKVCSVPGCGKPLTQMQGPGAEKLCRDHQVEQIEYGGYGRMDRPHTFHRSDICSCCGQNINDDPRWEKAQEYYSVVLTEEQKSRIKRQYNHGDHDFRKADGGNDSAENVNPLCTFCHWVKTVIFNDTRPKDSVDKN